MLPLLTFSCWAIVASALPSAGSPQSLDPLVLQWLSTQTNVTSWHASFRQTRHLRTLQQPLEAHGELWFSAPNLFRWEVQKPSPTVVVRTTNSMKILYPRLKRVEVYPMDGSLKGSWKNALELLEAGFPRSQADILGRFIVEDQTRNPTDFALSLRPRSGAASKFIKLIIIRFSPESFDLLSTELQLADGSRMINSFSSPARNPALPPDLFTPAIPPDFKITEPLAKP